MEVGGGREVDHDRAFDMTATNAYHALRIDCYRERDDPVRVVLDTSVLVAGNGFSRIRGAWRHGSHAA